jgi:hypothetical protein
MSLSTSPGTQFHSATELTCVLGMSLQGYWSSSLLYRLKHSKDDSALINAEHNTVREYLITAWQIEVDQPSMINSP